MEKKPKYLNSWKGQVLQALIIDNAKTWHELSYITNLDENALNRALAELFQLKVLDKRDEQYFIINSEIVLEYINYFRFLQQNSQTISDSKIDFIPKTKDAKHAQLVEYVINKEMFDTNSFKKTEHYFSHYAERGFIDVLKWTYEDSNLWMAIFEIKPVITDIGDTLRQIGRYKHFLLLDKDPMFKDISKIILTYLVVSNDKRNYNCLISHQSTFQYSGLNFLLFVNVQNRTEFLLPVMNYSEEDIRNLEFWIS